MTTTWRKFRCAGGAQWTERAGSPFADTNDGDECGVSGCKCHGRVKLMGLTSDVQEAHDWYKRVDEAFEMFPERWTRQEAKP